MVQRSTTTWKSTPLETKRSFIAASASLSTIFNTNNQAKSTASTSTYDTSNGNLLQSVEHGEVLGMNDGTFTEVGNDHRKTIVSYAINTPAHLSSFPSRQQFFNAENVLLSEQMTLYDGLPEGQVQKGNQTQSIQNFLEESRSIVSRTAYNDEGLPTEISDALGNTTLIHYDALSLSPEKITNPLGHETTLQYDHFFSQATRVTDANGLETEILLDGLGRVIQQKMSDPDQSNQQVTMSTTEYLENSFPHQVVHHIHLDDQTSADYYQYFDGFGRIIQTKAEDDGSANQYIVTNISYDALGRTHKSSLPVFVTGASYHQNHGSSIFTTTTFNIFNRPLTITDKNGTTTFSYNLWNSTITDALGNSKTTEADAFGRLVKVVERLEGAEHITKYNYDARDLLTKITDANSNERNFEYDSLGRLTLQEDLHNANDTDFGTRTYTYDDNGNALSTTKADGTVIQFTYDALNRPLTQTGPTISYEYTYDQGSNALGKLSSISGNDHTWSAEYDLRGRVTNESISLCETANCQLRTAFSKTYTYTRFNQPSTITSPNGLTQTYTYNQIGQIKEINSTAGGIITHISYSPLSQVEALSYGNGLRSVFTYDPNQMYRMSQKRTEPASVPVTFSAPIKNVATQTISSLLSSLPSVPSIPFVPFPRAHAEEIEVLPVEEQPDVIDDTEDPAREMMEKQLQLRHSKGINSDRRENILRDQDGGEIKKPTVLHTGPLPSNKKEKDLIYFRAKYENTKSTPSPAVMYQIMVEQNGTPVWDTGMVALTESLSAGSTGPYIAYDLSQLSDGEASWKIAFKLEDGTVTPWSDIETFSIGTLPTAPEIQDLQNIRYTYDAVGNIVQLSESSGTAATKTANYAYDDLYRLTSSTITGTTFGENYVQTQSYDPSGNILNKSDQGDYAYSQTGKTNPQAVTSISQSSPSSPSSHLSKTFTYDVNGNLTQEIQTNSDGSSLTKILNWNELDRITSIEVINEAGVSSTITFTYDQSGRRLSKTISYPFGTKTTLYPFPDYEVTSEGKTKISISGNNMHLATIESSTSTPDPLQGENPSSATRIIFSHTDHLGGGNILTDATGNQVQTLDYYPFGSIRVDEEYQNFDETKKFTGHEFDDASGLYYAQARYYDAETGRFVSGDPLQWRPGELMGRFAVNPQGFNFYSYTGNNPIVKTDPTGEAFFVPALIAGLWVVLEIVDAYLTAQDAACFINNPSLSTSAPLALNLATSGVPGNAIIARAFKILGNSFDALKITAKSGFKFSQTSASRFFQSAKEGSNFKYAGEPIDKVVDGLKNGTINPSDVPVGYVEIGGEKIIFDTRSAIAIQEAGIDLSKHATKIEDPKMIQIIKNRMQDNGLEKGASEIKLNSLDVNKLND
jgi:RHS repeat-associated protein